MSKKIQTNQKHMNQDSRVIIEKRLDTASPLSHIAEELGKDPTTIATSIPVLYPWAILIFQKR